MIDVNSKKGKAAFILADEINDMILLLEKAENVMDDISSRYFGKSAEPEGWALINEYKRYDVKSGIVVDYLIRLSDMLHSLEAGNEERNITP